MIDDFYFCYPQRQKIKGEQELKSIQAEVTNNNSEIFLFYLKKNYNNQLIIVYIACVLIAICIEN